MALLGQSGQLAPANPSGRSGLVTLLGQLLLSGQSARGNQLGQLGRSGRLLQLAPPEFQN